MTKEEAVSNPDPQGETSLLCCGRKPYYPFCQYKLIWLTILALAFLIVGLVSPGWFRLNVELYVGEGFTYRDMVYSSTYQDYNLWSVTQCLCKSYDSDCDCETRSYHFIQGINEKTKLAILAIPSFKDVEVYFNGTPLVFSIGTMMFLQACYVIGIVFATLNVYFAYELRMKSTIKFCTVINLQNAIAFSWIPAILTLIPGMVMGTKSMSIQSSMATKFEHRYYKMSSFGIIFGVIGGLIMLFYAIPMLIHTRCIPCGSGSERQYADGAQGAGAMDPAGGQQSDVTVELVKVTNTEEP
ncbi:hypothetical protein ACF0H5_018010 [Mactra antiquata]